MGRLRDFKRDNRGLPGCVPLGLGGPLPPGERNFTLSSLQLREQQAPPLDERQNNRQTTAMARGGRRSTSFKPGNQAAKGHRNAKLPSAIVDLRQAARALTGEAIATLRRLNNDETIAPVVQLAAANSILDRGWGKPKETVSGTMDVNMTRTDKLDISSLSEEQLDALEAALRATNMLLIEGNQGDGETHVPKKEGRG